MVHTCGPGRRMPAAACLIHLFETVPVGFDPGGQHRCTRYLDLTVLETGTGSPAPGAATVTARQPCKPGAPGMASSTGRLTLRKAQGAFLAILR